MMKIHKNKCAKFNLMNFDIIQYSDTYRESLLSLMKQMWIESTPDEVEKNFNWRYELNPFQKKDYMYLAVDENKRVIGFRAFVAQQFCHNKKSIDVFCPSDAFVHPEFRRRKIYSILTNALIGGLYYNKSDGIIISLSSNEKSTSANLALGWEKTNGMISYGYRVNVLGAFSGKTSSIKDEVELNAKGFSITFSNTIEEEELSAFHQQSPAEPVLVNCHSADYYLWRYKQHPQKEKYSFVYLRNNEKLHAYLIFNHLTPNQIMLEEYGYEKLEDLKLLMDKANKYLKPFVARTWILNKQEKRVLSRCGFIKEHPILTKALRMTRFPVTVRPLAAKPEEEDFFTLGLDIRDLNNWKLFKADSH